MMTEIDTPRLLLRQWQDSDYQPFARLNADVDVMAHFPTTLDEDASNQMANKCRQLINDNGWGFWAVELKENRAFIGFVGLHRPTITLPFSPCVEVGWRLAKAYWGKGLAMEAAREALVFGFMALGLDEIVSFTATSNKPSEAVMKRLHMDYKGLFEHPSLAKESPLLEHHLYGLTKAKWLSSK